MQEKADFALLTTLAKEPLDFNATYRDPIFHCWNLP